MITWIFCFWAVVRQNMASEQKAHLMAARKQREEEKTGARDKN
jgi:hypothetical protein